MKSIEFKDFRKGVSEQKLNEYLCKNVFFYNRVKGTVKFTSPYYKKYIEKEVTALVEIAYIVLIMFSRMMLLRIKTPKISQRLYITFRDRVSR